VTNDNHPHGQCEYCGRLNQNNPGDYYHWHDCWSRDVEQRLEAAKLFGASYEVIHRLERELEQARYVGD